MVAVVEQADGPAALEVGEEFFQGAGAFGEAESIEDFAAGGGSVAADHVAQVITG